MCVCVCVFVYDQAGRGGIPGSLYKIFFHFESFVHESIVLSFLPSTCIGQTVGVLLSQLLGIYDFP